MESNDISRHGFFKDNTSPNSNYTLIVLAIIATRKSSEDTLKSAEYVIKIRSNIGEETLQACTDP